MCFKLALSRLPLLVYIMFFIGLSMAFVLTNNFHYKYTAPSTHPSSPPPLYLPHYYFRECFGMKTF